MSLLQTVTDAKFVVVVYAVDSNAEQIAVAFEPNGKGDYINTRLTSLFLTSSYGKNNYIRTPTVFVMKKERAYRSDSQQSESTSRNGAPFVAMISQSTAKNNPSTENNIKKHVVDIKYAKDDLSQVNPQLYEWLAIINDKSSYDDRLPQNSYKSNPLQGKNNRWIYKERRDVAI